MSEQPNDDNLHSAWESLRRYADQGREPQLLAAQMGRRQVSFNALVEQVEREFIEEFTDSEQLRAADTATGRLKLLLKVVDYVLAIESVQMNNDDKAALMNAAYSNLFGYGPLDALFLDDRVTTISLQGVDKAAVRYGHGELESLGPIFEDEIQLRRILRRLLLDADADLLDSLPFIETGLQVAGRPVSISLVTPMMAFGYNADIRVHPQQAVTLNDLIANEFLTEKAATLLKTLTQSTNGFVIAGDTESGKTTLLNAMLLTLPDSAHTIAVERASELRLPDEMTGLRVQWQVDGQAEISFGDQITNALEQSPACIILDEVRADEPLSIGPLLENDDAPRQIWSFRGPFDSKRLQNALSMLARRSNVGMGEALVHALYERLPFIVTLWRAHGQIRLYSIGEWQFRESDYPDYVVLMDTVNGELRLTGEQPIQALDLPADFWTT